MRYVLKLGGSIFPHLRKILPGLEALAERCDQLAIVVGGGELCREVMAQTPSDLSEAEKDLINIRVTRINAGILGAHLLGSITVPESIDGARRLLERQSVVIMGGTEPGHSTDAVASLLGELMGADLYLKATSVAGVFDKDPKKNKEAKLLRDMKLSELQSMVEELDQNAGTYRLFDLSAVHLLKRSGIPAFLFDGTKKEAYISLSEGKRPRGTNVSLG